MLTAAGQVQEEAVTLSGWYVGYVIAAVVIVVVVNKIDLLPHLDFDLDLFLANLKAVNPQAVVIKASARTGEGLDEWCSWLGGSAANWVR